MKLRNKSGQLYIFAMILLFILFIGMLYLTLYQVFASVRDRTLVLYYPDDVYYRVETSNFINSIFQWFPVIALVGGLLLWVLANAQKKRRYF